MYILITGRHPMYKKGEKTDNYLMKIKEPKWRFPKEFSILARDLFLKLVKVDPLERYTAKEALAHPWITRIPNNIPLAYSDKSVYEQSRRKLDNVIYFLS